MRAVHVYADLQRFGKLVFTTEDAALRLRAKKPAMSRSLHRLAEAGLVLQLRHGLWSLDSRIDPFTVPEYLTAPFPSYVSFQSALYFHKMISQIPQVIYVASLAPTRRIETKIASYSIHRLQPDFFGGFDTPREHLRLATPEKALLDVLYLRTARSRLFAALPEVTLPRNFDEGAAQQWIGRLPRYRATMVSRALSELLSRRRSRKRAPGRVT